MTGPGPGKIEIDCEKLIIISGTKTLTIIPRVYIHIKGWSLARVTHIDVEHDDLCEILNIKPREIIGGILINSKDNIEVKTRKAILKIYSKILTSLIPTNYRGGCVIGGKIGGVFIGVRKEIIRILEKYGEKHGYAPRRRLE
ncbi:MAG: hypothetical protein GXO26_00970 [Crenarchaeota archaeon]|nr:hypothetical protein [Thermoproteota archaeon]